MMNADVAEHSEAQHHMALLGTSLSSRSTLPVDAPIVPAAMACPVLPEVTEDGTGRTSAHKHIDPNAQHKALLNEPRSLMAFTPDVLRVAGILTVKEGTKPVGSFRYEAFAHPSDIDFMEVGHVPLSSRHLQHNHQEKKKKKKKRKR